MRAAAAARVPVVAVADGADAAGTMDDFAVAVTLGVERISAPSLFTDASDAVLTDAARSCGVAVEATLEPQALLHAVGPLRLLSATAAVVAGASLLSGSGSEPFDRNALLASMVYQYGFSWAEASQGPPAAFNACLAPMGRPQRSPAGRECFETAQPTSASWLQQVSRPVCGPCGWRQLLEGCQVAYPSRTFANPSQPAPDPTGAGAHAAAGCGARLPPAAPPQRGSCVQLHCRAGWCSQWRRYRAQGAVGAECSRRTRRGGGSHVSQRASICGSGRVRCVPRAQRCRRGGTLRSEPERKNGVGPSGGTCGAGAVGQSGGGQQRTRGVGASVAHGVGCAACQRRCHRRS